MKTIYVLADGLTENPALGPMVIDEANVPNLQILAATGEAGWYHPATRPFAVGPETFVVFPYFFGMSPECNPGRAGLELSLAGVNLDLAPCSAVVRVVPLDFEPALGWEAAPPLSSPAVVEEVSRVARVAGVHVFRSPLSRRGNVFCVGADCRESLDGFLCSLAAKLPRYGYLALPSQHSFVTTRSMPERETTFFGWAMGGLHAALALCNVAIRQNDGMYNFDSLGDFPAKRRDLCERILPRVNVAQADAIIYLKEPSAFARSGSRVRKREAVEFVDWVVGALLHEVSDYHARIVVISDHRSDVGREETLPGAALYITGIIGAARRGGVSASPTRIADERAVLDQVSLVHRLRMMCE